MRVAPFFFAMYSLAFRPVFCQAKMRHFGTKKWIKRKAVPTAFSDENGNPGKAGFPGGSLFLHLPEEEDGGCGEGRRGVEADDP